MCAGFPSSLKLVAFSPDPGFSPGGSVDIMARAVAEEMSALLGQRLLVVNREGASGAVAMAALAAAAPDGYTLGIGPATPITNVLHVQKDASYRLESFDAGDVATAHEVIEAFADLAVGLADASIVVLSRRYETLDVLTLDERHFRTLRGTTGRPFRILPADAPR